jgi:transposase
VDDTDSTGQILSMVLRWRELRKAALTAEISRIRGILETRGEKLKAEAQYMKQVAAQAEEDDDDYGTMGGADDEDDEYADEL